MLVPFIRRIVMIYKWYSILMCLCMFLSQPVTVSSSDETTEPQAVSEENSREAARKAEEFTLDSSDFLHIDEDLNLEELMKQKLSRYTYTVYAFLFMKEIEEKNMHYSYPSPGESPWKLYIEQSVHPLFYYFFIQSNVILQFFECSIHSHLLYSLPSFPPSTTGCPPGVFRGIHERHGGRGQ